MTTRAVLAGLAATVWAPLCLMPACAAAPGQVDGQADGRAASGPAHRAAAARAMTEYVVSLDDAAAQMIGVSMTMRGVEGKSVDVALPTWRPGRYEVLDPAGTVRDVRARSGDGAELPIEKRRKSVWRIETGGADEVTVSYRLYANSLNNRTRHADDTHAFLSGSSVFMFGPQADEPAVVRIEGKPDWRVATGLAPADDSGRVFLAPDYDLLVDSPLEIGELHVVEFEARGVPHEVAIWGDAGPDDEKIIRDFGRIIEEQAKIFGGLPYERYVFLVHSTDSGGGGTEHYNSTIMQTRPATWTSDSAWDRFLGLVSHEFFHTWNVKRFRPAGLTPYDYLEENYTDLLWVVEGSTSYYDDLTLARAGLVKPNRYLEAISDNIDTIRKRPGASVQSLADSSYDAWIKFNKSTPDDVNSTVSFYTKGALATLLLDLKLREMTGNERSFDDVMRTLHERYPYGATGYTTPELIGILDELAGQRGAFRPLFDRHVAGTETLPLEEAFGVVGLELRFEPSDNDRPEAPYLGLRLSGGSPAPVSAVLADGPAYGSGLIVGDQVVAIDGRRAQRDVEEMLEDLEPGESVTITYFRRDELREARITPVWRPAGDWKLSRVDEPTEAQTAAYEGWIGQPWPGAGEESLDESEEEGEAGEDGVAAAAGSGAAGGE
jgi:predicted metalloprotease with PDZ domain